MPHAWWNPFSWNWGKIGTTIKKGAKKVAKVAYCTAAIGVAVTPGGKAAKLTKELGGVRKTAQLLVGAGTSSDVKKILGNSAVSILGIAQVREACF